MKNKKRLTLTFVYILLIVLSIIWLFPIVWVVLTSFRGEGTAYVNYLIPKTWTLDNYIKLFTSSAFPFGQWFFMYHFNLYHSSYGLLIEPYQIQTPQWFP